MSVMTDILFSLLPLIPLVWSTGAACGACMNWAERNRLIVPQSGLTMLR
jgi:hypothetical protein